jgi:hypothetical protein
LFIVLVFASCGKPTQEKAIVQIDTEKVEATNQKTDSLTTATNDNSNNKEVVERYFPSEKESVLFDTIISASNLSISIKSTNIESYVINEFETEDTKHIDKYRDSEKHLIIKKAGHTLIDTVFTKDNFSALTGHEFLKVGDFRGYWFRELKNDRIEFFGVISKPETDWSTPFYHYFDLKTQSFKIEKYIEEPI